MKAFIPRSTSALAMLAALALAGCASSVKLDEPPVESRTPGAAGGAGGAGADGRGTPQSQVANVDLSKQQGDAANALPKVVYFDFDSFVVKDEFRPVVESHAKLLSGDRARRVVVEGHTDERGGREYNLALGQRRAEAVRRSLGLLGVTDSQVEAVSFGKEKPAAPGSDEASFAKNRRAEIAYR